MNWLREAESEPIPGYRLVHPLGTGGFGEVWKCVAPGGIHKAIKFVYGNLNTLDDDSAKAEQEFKAMERVKAVRHPFVLSMERIDVVNGELLIVMELADQSLFDLMQNYQQEGHVGIPRDLLLGYLSDSAEGLDHLIERHNLQHLDVKPKNLFLIGDRVKVADFGLVKHLERQSASGLLGGITPIYAAPETFANKISKHSDQYSLAILFVELLTGMRPFNGKNIRQLAMQHMAEAPDLGMLGDSDRAVVARALSKNPEERFPSCVAFVKALGGNNLRDDVKSGSSGLSEPRPLRNRPATMIDLDVSMGITHAVAPGAKPGTHRFSPAELIRRLPEVPDLHQSVSMSVSFHPEEGVLRPAVLIGVGSFGERALQQIRCRLLDRVGDLSQVPCLRFLAIDCEPEGTRPPASMVDSALQPEHLFAAPLQPVTGYRRRQLDQILDWLPREKLYSIPRSLRVDGSRALGRLAFCDHYLRFLTRFRHEVQVATHPEALRESADQTGLAVRTTVPSVYVFASASGGTGGMLLDLGHAVRRALDRYNLSESPVTAFVFAGAPEDSATPAAEQANVFATVTELHHFSDPEMRFASQYGGPEGPRIDAAGLPFAATYLLPMTARTPEAFRDCVSHLAGYVTHDLTTPLGTGLEKLRKAGVPTGRTPFRGFGTFGVWYPRGLLVRSAARQLCARFLRSWAAFGQVPVPDDARRLLDNVLGDVRLTPDEVKGFIAAGSATAGDPNPAEAVRGWASHLADQAEAAARRPDPLTWAVAAWDQCRDLTGNEPTTEADSPFRRGRVSRALDLGLRQASEAWQNELNELLRPLDELPGPRVAVAETVYAHLAAACTAAAQAVETHLHQAGEARQRCRADVQAALDGCQNLADGGGFSLFGGRAARNLRAVAVQLKTFAELRLKEDLALCAAQFYRRLHGWIDDRVRDLAFARGRLTGLAGELEAHMMLPHPGGVTTPAVGEPGLHDTEEAMQTTLHESNTMRVVLPHGEEHLDKSAADLLAGIAPADQTRLELILTRLVVDPRGGLSGVCRTSPELFPALASPMIEQATAFLENLVPSEDVTAVELSAGGGAGELGPRIASYVRAAAPLARGPADEERTFVMVPDTDAGRQYAEGVRQAVPGATTVHVRGIDTDLLFCREQGCLRPSDLSRLLEPCWEAYAEATARVECNPHARFDVVDWLPLVE